MPTLRQAVRRLRVRWILPPSGTVSVKDLNQRFRPVEPGSMRSLLLKMNTLADVAEPVGGSTHPYYRRSKPTPQNLIDFANDTTHIDFTHAHMEAYGVSDPVSEATGLFDKRAAAAVLAAVGLELGVRIYPKVIWLSVESDLLFQMQLPFHVDDSIPEGIVSKDCCTNLVSDKDLLEMKYYGDAGPTIYIPTAKCLAAMAYPDYFPEIDVVTDPNDITAGTRLRRMVSEAILAARPGWCGTFGPGVDSLYDFIGDDDPLEGNYDMSQMHLLQIAYRYYDELSPEARELLIRVLLAMGRIHRPDADDIVTSGRVPEDWSRAGHIHVLSTKIRIGETENHILTIHTARYLTNQLLYQRDQSPDPDHDNRTNGGHGRLSCTELLLYLLRNILRDDFSEYNAKPYQTETRSALLNLCSYAYDHEVRLAARMVLDYISAHIAVSSCDLRRMVPFRRLNKDEHVTRLSGVDNDFMGVGLLETSLGADPMAEPFAIQAGNTRAYATPNFTSLPSDNQPPTLARPWSWAIAGDGGAAVAEALSDYRLPSSIHDLFVNDLHRRFFQRLHRFKRFDEVEGAGALDEDATGVSGRNVDNMEIYAGSPSYLITAGGAPAWYAIDPGLSIVFKKGREKSAQQLGVAVPTSFMPTGLRADPDTQNSAKDLIQFGAFSEGSSFVQDGKLVQSSPTVANYGVAPDFACGHKVYLPFWVVSTAQRDGQFLFVDRGSPLPLPGVVTEPPGFYLAIFNEGEFPFLEAFDTWLHPGVTFQDFIWGVKEANPNIKVENNVECQYKTQNGNRLHFVIWKDGKRENDATHGARILRIEYVVKDCTDRLGDKDCMDRLGDAGNITDKFLNGAVMNSTQEAVVEITNPFLGTKITLDMSDQKRPKRTSESGEVEEAGSNHEVWVNFGWKGPNEGDFFRPFNTITAAAAAVADRGVIKIMPGWTTEKPTYEKNKRIRLIAPIGNVTFGVR
jgi:hypothetical protein